MLTFFHETNPTDERLFAAERCILAPDFTRLGHIFCYCYKVGSFANMSDMSDILTSFQGEFLPTGSADGRVWKPSQSAKQTGIDMLKRYFYCREPDGSRIRRFVEISVDNTRTD